MFPGLAFCVETQSEANTEWGWAPQITSLALLLGYIFILMAEFSSHSVRLAHLIYERLNWDGGCYLAEMATTLRNCEGLSGGSGRDKQWRTHLTKGAGLQPAFKNHIQKCRQLGNSQSCQYHFHLSFLPTSIFPFKSKAEVRHTFGRKLSKFILWKCTAPKDPLISNSIFWNWNWIDYRMICLFLPQS